MADRVLRLLVDLPVDRCAEECPHTLPIPWKQNQEIYQLRYVFGYAMEEVTSRATSFGRSVLQNNPSGALMLGKDWMQLDTYVYMAPLGIEHFFDAFCFNPQRSGGQLQSKLWASLPAVYQKMPIWKICRGAPSRLRLDVFRLKGKHWLQRRRECLRLALMLRVDGRECQITPLRTRNVRIWRLHQLPLTRIGSKPHVALGKSWLVHLYGGAARFFSFPPLPSPRWSKCTHMGSHSQELGSSTAILIGMWHDKS